MVVISSMERLDTMNSSPPVREPASYYRGIFPFVLSFLLSPGLWLLLGVTPRVANFLFSVFVVCLFIAILLPRNKKFLQRVFKATLVSFVLCVIMFGGIDTVVSALQGEEVSHLGNRRRDDLLSIGIALKYMALFGKLCGLVPLVSFVVLWCLRRYWNISVALLLAVSNLPFVPVLLVFF